MNIDIRLSVGFWDHPKTNKTIKRLGLEGIRSLQILWLWAATNRPDGTLSGMDCEDIEFAADWRGQERAFFDECFNKWIYETPDGFILHDWQEHNPWQAEAKARSDKAKKAAESRWSNAKEDNKQCSSNAQAMLKHDSSNAPLLSSPLLSKEQSKDCLSSSAPNDETKNPVKSSVPDCNYHEVIKLYHEILPELPAVKTCDGTRKSHIQTRWRETYQRLKKADKTCDAQSLLDWWRKFFQAVRASDFLMGRVDQRGRTWQAGIDFLVTPKGYTGVLEGKYLNQVR